MLNLLALDRLATHLLIIHQSLVLHGSLEDFRLSLSDQVYVLFICLITPSVLHLLPKEVQVVIGWALFRGPLRNASVWRLDVVLDYNRLFRLFKLLVKTWRKFLTATIRGHFVYNFLEPNYIQNILTIIQLLHWVANGLVKTNVLHWVA